MRYRTLVALGGMFTLAALCGLLLFGWQSATPAPGSYRAAVELVLLQRGIEHQGLQVVDGCAPTLQLCRHYHGSVTVQFGRPLQGVIDCHWRWTGCTLTLVELGIHAEPLHDTGLPLSLQDLEQAAQDVFDLFGRAPR